MIRSNSLPLPADTVYVYVKSRPAMRYVGIQE